jgi:hypothetical protein
MKTYEGSGCITPGILNLDAGRKWSNSSTDRFTPGETAPEPNWMRLKAGMDAASKRENPVLLAGIEPRSFSP